MAKHGRIVVIPHRRAEPDLDQIVLALLRTLDDHAQLAVEIETADEPPAPSDRRAS